MSDRKAETTAIYFLKYACTFGFPKSILTDQDPVFTSALIKEVNKLFDIQQKFTSPYHPQTNGSLERTHSYIENYLRAYIDAEMNNWDEMLYLATFSFNSHKNRSTNETPYTLVFGIEPHIPTSFEKNTTRKTYQNLSKEVQDKLKRIRTVARDNLTRSKEINKAQYDKKQTKPRTFNVGDDVLIKEGQAAPGKLKNRFRGPFKIISVHPESHTVTIRMKKSNKTYHENNVKHYISDDVVNVVRGSTKSSGDDRTTGGTN